MVRRNAGPGLDDDVEPSLDQSGQHIGHERNPLLVRHRLPNDSDPHQAHLRRFLGRNTRIPDNRSTTMKSTQKSCY